MKDHEIVVKAGGRDIAATRGELLGDILQRAGVALPRDCGGRGLCGKCLVKLYPMGAASPPGESELAILSADQTAGGIRLACQVTVLDSLEAQPLREERERGQAEAYKSRLRGRFAVRHGLRRITLIGGQEATIDSDGQCASLVSRLAARAGEKELVFSPSAMEQLSGLAFRREDMTLVVENREVLSVLQGINPRSLGLALDIGTTTLGVYLCDMAGGQIVASDSSANPQRRFGDDVISRISAAGENPSAAAAMRQLSLSAVNQLIRSVCLRAGCPTEDIDEVCVVGNPTMQTLFLGWNPTSLGMAPYLPATNEPQRFYAEAMGLCLHGGARVRFLPMVSGFIGGDTIAAALCIESGQGEGPVLALDLGTNGELFLLKDGQAWAASAATGPAFEGANIERGTRATPGAVERVWWNEDAATFGHRLSPGNGRQDRALGICGSGLIDAVAVLLEQGMIDSTGRLLAGKPGVVSDHQGGARAVELLPAESCADGNPLYLSQADIRQVQLAKAALRVGLEYLLNVSGCDRVARTVITGAFGAGFHWPSASCIGLLPAEHRLGKIETTQNAAGVGAVMALLDDEKRRWAEELGRRIQVVELNRQADFNDRFIEALNFPPRAGEA